MAGELVPLHRTNTKSQPAGGRRLLHAHAQTGSSYSNSLNGRLMLCSAVVNVLNVYVNVHPNVLINVQLKCSRKCLRTFKRTFE